MEFFEHLPEECSTELPAISSPKEIGRIAAMKPGVSELYRPKPVKLPIYPGGVISAPHLALPNKISGSV